MLGMLVSSRVGRFLARRWLAGGAVGRLVWALPLVLWLGGLVLVAYIWSRIACCR